MRTPRPELPILFSVQQEAQLSQRGRAMPRVVEYFMAVSLKAALSGIMVTFANLGI